MPTSIETNRTARNFQNICEILERYNYDPAKIIPILQEVQEAYRYLPQEVMTYVATSLAIPPARVFGIATFYSHFAIEPKGQYVIKLCDGTACHVRGSNPILDAIRTHLKLDEKNRTTPDMLFTVETVSCLGACGLAPVMLINDDVYGQITPEKAVELVKAIQESESK